MKVSLNKLVAFSVVGPGMISPLFKLIIVLGLLIKSQQHLKDNYKVPSLTYWLLIIVTLLLFHSTLTQLTFFKEISISGFSMKVVGMFIFLLAYQTPSIHYRRYILYILTLSEIILILQFSNISLVLAIYPADTVDRFSGLTGASTLVGLAAIMKLNSVKITYRYFLVHLPISIFCCYVSGSIASIFMLGLYITGIFLISFHLKALVRFLIKFGIFLTIVMTLLWTYLIIAVPETFAQLQVFQIFDAGDVKRVKLFLQLSNGFGENPILAFTGLGVGTLNSYPELFMTRHFESGLLECISSIGVPLTVALLATPLLVAKNLDTDQFLIIGIIVLMFIFVPIFLNYFVCLALGYTFNFYRRHCAHS